MADAKKCDRCGKYYTKNENTFRVNNEIVAGFSLVDNGDYRIKKYDICNDCAEDLWNWLNECKEVTE